MANQRIIDLSGVSTLDSDTYLVTDNATDGSLKISYTALAKAILETYSASTLAGSAQSVQNAFSKLVPTSISATAAENVTIVRQKCYAFSDFVVYNLAITVSSDLTNGTAIFSFPTGYTVLGQTDIMLIASTPRQGIISGGSNIVTVNGSVPAGTYFVTGIIYMT